MSWHTELQPVDVIGAISGCVLVGINGGFGIKFTLGPDGIWLNETLYMLENIKHWSIEDP